jgi:hypothetical protein
MGTYTYQNFQDYLKFNLGQRTDIVTYLGNWVNQAYVDLTTKNKFWDLKMPTNFDFPELRTSTTATTTAGTPYIVSPTDLLYIRHIHNDTSDMKLDKIRFMEYVRDTGRATSNSYSKPLQWIRDGGNIYLYPTPDATYTLSVYYRKRPAAMSATTDTTVIGAEWDEPILWLATVQACMRLNDFDKMKIWLEALVESLSSKLGIYAKEEVDTADKFRPDFAHKELFKYRS